jgi:N-methylhydantoinase A
MTEPKGSLERVGGTTVWRVGIDIGGTFTDLAASDAEGSRLLLRKVPSTPPDLASGAARALEEAGRQLPLEAVTFLGHGTTAGTNALIEGTGAGTGLLTTMGFRDLLEIARQQRPSLYDLGARKPRPLVPRRLRREVPERLHCDGSVRRPLNMEAASQELAELRQENVEAIAICFLHSYVNPAHERAVRDLARRVLPGVYLTASSDLLPRFREYERLSTTVVNAYLGPLMNHYLDDLKERVAESGVKAVVHIMQSNGGLISLDQARNRPAATVLSGPAAGAAAAADMCSQLGVRRAISMDMGGTSTDVCVIDGGLPASAPGREVGGYVVELPGVDVRCIGAGGGSILSLDRAGLPQLGPGSAGADPGPVCYCRGGQEPTLTDALLALGRLAPAGLLGGEVPMDLSSARNALQEKVAQSLGVSVEQAAQGGVSLAVANVRRAVEGITVARGHDPREFSLIAAGGAGPMIACEVAEALEIGEVIVPAWPGNFSAWGLLASDLRRDWVETHLIAGSAERLSELSEELHRLEGEARRWLAECSLPEARWLLLRRVAARYEGQDYELEVDVPPEEPTEQGLRRVVARFHKLHEQHYGYALPERPVELVDLIVTAVGQVERPGSRGGQRSCEREETRRGERAVFLEQPDGYRRCPIYRRDGLSVGEELAGPAVIEQYDSTIFIPVGWRARVVNGGILRMKRAAGS